jgi:hypothetical protein
MRSLGNLAETLSSWLRRVALFNHGPEARHVQFQCNKYVIRINFRSRSDKCCGISASGRAQSVCATTGPWIFLHSPPLGVEATRSPSGHQIRSLLCEQASDAPRFNTSNHKEVWTRSIQLKLLAILCLEWWLCSSRPLCTRTLRSFRCLAAS